MRWRPYAACVNARQLLAGLPESIEFPQATVSSDGEIILTWFRGNDRLDAFLGPDAHLTWVYRIESNIEDGGDVAMEEVGALDRFFASVTQFYT